MAKSAEKRANRGKTVAKARVAGRPSLVPNDDGPPPSDWGSLLADLSGDESRREPEWGIHDRTHLEFALEYDLSEAKGPQDFSWDVFFFLPKSLRLHAQSYGNKEIYEDLQSYVRYAVPHVSLEEIVDKPIARLGATLDGGDEEGSLRELRLFACLVRAAGVRTQRAILERLRDEEPDMELACAAALEMAQAAHAVTAALRETLAAIPATRLARQEALAEGARWVDEDVSRVLETLLAAHAIELRQ